MNDRLSGPALRPRAGGSAWSVGLNWLVLALPGAALLIHDATHRSRHDYVGYSGIFAAVLLILTLAVTPLLRLLPAGDHLRLLKRNRRYLGVAAFAYTLLHLAFYIKEGPSPRAFLRTFIRPEMAVGWLSFAIMALLAWTSFDSSMQRMGPAWKRLHRWSYAAGVLGFLHWALAANPVEAVLYFLPLVLLRIAAAVVRTSRRA